MGWHAVPFSDADCRVDECGTSGANSMCSYEWKNRRNTGIILGAVYSGHTDLTVCVCTIWNRIDDTCNYSFDFRLSIQKEKRKVAAYWLYYNTKRASFCMAVEWRSLCP